MLPRLKKILLFLCVVLEFTCKAILTPWLYIQPDAQFIINPGATQDLKNAFVIGGRVSIDFQPDSAVGSPFCCPSSNITKNEDEHEGNLVSGKSHATGVRCRSRCLPQFSQAFPRLRQ